jgi:DNA-binding NarL/FixJ family response regulator
VVILDLMLPDGNGGTVLSAIRAQGLSARVLVTTAVIDSDRLDQVRAMDPEVILQKPIDLPRLLTLMQPLN